jgi:hypothetical protein
VAERASARASPVTSAESFATLVARGSGRASASVNWAQECLSCSHISHHLAVAETHLRGRISRRCLPVR